MTQENENKHLDFDQFIDEQKEQGPTITIYGETVQLTPSLPANIMVTTVRMMKSKKAETQIEDLMGIAHSIFGEERFEKWLKKGLSMEQLEALISRTIEMYTGTPTKRGKR